MDREYNPLGLVFGPCKMETSGFLCQECPVPAQGESPCDALLTLWRCAVQMMADFFQETAGRASALACILHGCISTCLFLYAIISKPVMPSAILSGFCWRSYLIAPQRAVKAEGRTFAIQLEEVVMEGAACSTCLLCHVQTACLAFLHLTCSRSGCPTACTTPREALAKWVVVHSHMPVDRVSHPRECGCGVNILPFDREIVLAWTTCPKSEFLQRGDMAGLGAPELCPRCASAAHEERMCPDAQIPCVHHVADRNGSL